MAVDLSTLKVGDILYDNWTTTVEPFKVLNISAKQIKVQEVFEAEGKYGYTRKVKASQVEKYWAYTKKEVLERILQNRLEDLEYTKQAIEELRQQIRDEENKASTA